MVRQKVYLMIILWRNMGTDTYPKKYLEWVLAQYYTTVSPEIYAEIAHSNPAAGELEL
jgi:hypothetical protein